MHLSVLDRAQEVSIHFFRHTPALKTVQLFQTYPSYFDGRSMSRMSPEMFLSCVVNTHQVVMGLKTLYLVLISSGTG